MAVATGCLCAGVRPVGRYSGSAMLSPCCVERRVGMMGVGCIFSGVFRVGWWVVSAVGNSHYNLCSSVSDGSGHILRCVLPSPGSFGPRLGRVGPPLSPEVRIVGGVGLGDP